MTTALVTGANKGIGRAIADNLARRGHRVLVGARDEERGRQTVKDLRGNGALANFLHIDVADIASVDAAAAFVKETYPDLDLLINNAGIPGYPMHAPGWTFDADTLEQVWRTNFLGPFELVKQLVGLLASNNGTILNVSIPIAPNQQFNAFAYQASKAPLNVMTKSLGLTFEKEDIPVRIMAVAPGGTSTDLNGHIRGPHVKTPKQAADVITGFLFDGHNHNGEILNYDGRTFRV